MRLSELQYELPPDLIAQRPADQRDEARLLIVDRAAERIEHAVFRDIGTWLSPGDCLVLNDTRVVKARFYCHRTTGGRIEALFLHADDNGWHVLLKPSARLKVGEQLTCTGIDVRLRLTERGSRGAWVVQPTPDIEPLALLDDVGTPPLPPYIHRTDGLSELRDLDLDRYQTVYADRPGAVAAPTAGLHFTPELLENLYDAGIHETRITLHVGAGTFTPIATDDLAAHQMHAEWYEASEHTISQLQATRAAGHHIVAVGTTATRVLESLGRDRPAEDALVAGSGWTDIFIYPPYHFRHVDRLITNFHLPGSTLLALVMAFASPGLIRRAYREAIDRRYRFYSYGDAMLIL